MRYNSQECMMWESNVGRGRNLHPNAAAGTEASLSLFFSGNELNLEGRGEKKFCP